METDVTPMRAVVLVVQDEPLLTLAMIDFVEEADCEALVVLKAAEAVQVLEARPDIRAVFIDIDLRGALLGARLAAIIRDRWPPIELVLATTRPWAVAELPERAILVGKPFEEAKIIRAIRAFTT